MKLKNQITGCMFFVFAAGCADQSSYIVDPKDSSKLITSAQVSENQKQINDYLYSLSNWSQVSPEKKDDKRFLESKNENGKIILPTGKEVLTQCKIEKYDLTRTPDEVIMNDTISGVVYPGALIQGEGYLQGPGGLRELSIRKRRPLQVVVDLSNEGNSSTMTQVDYAGFQKSYSEIIKNIKNSQVEIPSYVSFKQIETQEVNSAALNLGISAKYLTADLDSNLRSNTQADSKTYMVVFKQKAFTLSAVIPSTPAEFFSEDFTVSDLKQQESIGAINDHNLPLYVSSVTYGRILIFTITSKASKEDIQGALKASYQNPLMNINGDLKAKYQKILSGASINILVNGGDKKNTEKLIRNLNLDSYFSGDTSVETFVPMTYILRNLKDNSVAKVSETTEYTTKKCDEVLAKAYKVRITIEKIVMKYTGSMSGSSEIYGDLSLNNKRIWSRSRDQYVSTAKGKELETNLMQKPMDFVLSTRTYQPVVLNARFVDNNIVQDSQIASFNEEIAYDNNFRVKEPGSYQTDSQKGVTIYYKLERLDSIYE